MSGVYRPAITESEAELKAPLGTPKTAPAKERIQLLYLSRGTKVVGPD